MKYLYIGFNIILIIMISIFIFVNPNQKNISLNNDSKVLTTSVFKTIQMRKIAEKEKEEAKKTEEEKEKEKKDVAQVVESAPQSVIENTAPVSVDSTVLETQVGALAAYGPDCSGCSGHLAAGFDASGGNIYYNDSTYGNIRILAGDSKYNFGTIVRVSGTSLGTFNAIVLDRGGGVGFGRRFLFDLLCPSNADAWGVGSFQNVTFEILRYGY